jgi:hypothetical protein
MDCAQFEEIVHDLERASTQGFALRADALGHAESCVRCGLLLEEVMSLDFALDALAAQDAHEQASPRVEAALLAEFRRQQAEPVRPQGNLRWSVALAMAAALILAVGITAPRWILRNSNRASNGSASVIQATATSATTAGTETSATASDSEYATNFVSLPYADDPGALDGATVVRVTLSRAALASFGLPVADISPNDQVPADIALSEDGVPQAIRLVASADLDRTN